MLFEACERDIYLKTTKKGGAYVRTIRLTKREVINGGKHHLSRRPA